MVVFCCSDGFFFAIKEVSLLDQGSQGRQSIYQLEQVIGCGLLFSLALAFFFFVVVAFISHKLSSSDLVSPICRRLLF
ncbi:unnamed protein product [Linum tenue]|uniref:Uncharacterized protein n=1 Tax=Linum tenue TaxID=586396 RepID=A0AAV0IEK2_9ROSI|nr:unnamed protein product [Linum tenue]